MYLPWPALWVHMHLPREYTCTNPVFAQHDALWKVREMRRGSLYKQQQPLVVKGSEWNHVRQQMAPDDLSRPAVYTKHLQDQAADYIFC